MSDAKEILEKLISYGKGNNDSSKISQLEHKIAENIKEFVIEDVFLNDLPFDNIYNIFKDIDYEDNALPTSTLKTVIQKLNQRDPFKSFSLLMYISQPYLTLTECISLLSNFTQSPLLMQLCVLFNEFYQQRQLDFEYEIGRKDHIISQLEEELLDAKFPPQKEKPQSFEPDIHKAANNGQLESVQYLIEKEGIDPNAVDDNGYSPLINAAQNGHLHVVQYLRERQNADIDIHDKNGHTALMHATYNGKLPIVEYLIEAQNANPIEQDDVGFSLLHFAVKGNSFETLKYLIENIHLPLDTVTNNGETPLDLASKDNHSEIYSYLTQL